MKRAASIILVLVFCLLLTACGKEPTITDTLEYPVASDSLSECEKFLRNCGYKIVSVKGSDIYFTGSQWEGYASLDFPVELSLDYNHFASGSDADLDTVAEAVRAEIYSLCGEPYGDMKSTLHAMYKEYFRYGDKTVTMTISTYSPTTEGINITIRQAVD